MKQMTISMDDGSKWAVPVDLIIKNRATHYQDQFGSLEESIEDTKSLFKDEFEIEDWAENNMNWSDVKDHAKKIEDSKADYQEGWVNGEKDFIDDQVGA